jgi:hypothetical protein
MRLLNVSHETHLEASSINEALRMIAGEDEEVPLLERKREIVAGQAKERQKGGQGGVLLVENLPQANDKTRDAVAAEIGVSAPAWIDAGR